MSVESPGTSVHLSAFSSERLSPLGLDRSLFMEYLITYRLINSPLHSKKVPKVSGSFCIPMYGVYGCAYWGLGGGVVSAHSRVSYTPLFLSVHFSSSIRAFRN